MKVMIPGVAGTLARKVAIALAEAGHEVAGLDTRPWKNPPPSVDFHQVDVRKRGAEDLFRTRRPNAVIHMATVTAFMVPGEERHRINLGGTRAIFEHSRAYGVEHVIFVGRHTFYGASSDAPLYHTEDEPPGQSLDSFPELADLVSADLYAATELWRLPQITTSILRCCYTFGPSGHGTLASFLRAPRVPTVLGYDPLFQFMHEDDLVAAVVLALDKRPRGIFNVAGPIPLPLSVIVNRVGKSPLPLPEWALKLILRRGPYAGLSTGAVEHLKYPVVVSNKAFVEATGFEPRYDELATLAHGSTQGRSEAG